MSHTFLLLSVVCLAHFPLSQASAMDLIFLVKISTGEKSQQIYQTESQWRSAGTHPRLRCFGVEKPSSNR